MECLSCICKNSSYLQLKETLTNKCGLGIWYLKSKIKNIPPTHTYNTQINKRRNLKQLYYLKKKDIGEEATKKA